MSVVAVLVALSLGASTPSSDAGVLEELVPAEAVRPTPSLEVFVSSAPVVARAFGEADLLLGIDPSRSLPTDPFPVNVLDLRAQARLGLDVKLSDSVRVRVEGRAWWRGVAESGFARAKAVFEPTVGEAFVDLYQKGFDLRLGNQIFSLGANPAFAPVDQLNPRDLRLSFLQAEPEDAKIPVLAARAQGEWRRWRWLAIVVPFFQPDRYNVFGQNEALVQPGWGVTIPIKVDPSIEDEIQPQLLETRRPYWGDVAARVSTEIERVKIGGSYAWVNEKLPEVTVDPELAALLNASAQGAAPDPALQLSVENRLRAGQQLFTGTYGRQHIFSLEGSRVIGPAQLDVDVGFSPQQTFVNESFAPVRKAALTWVVGITQAEDSAWIYNLTYVGLAVFGVQAQELLALIEPGTARGVNRTAWLHVLIASVSRKLVNDKLEVGARAAFEPIQRSYALGPRVTYRARERFTFLLAAELYEGTPYSPFGYYHRATQLWLGAKIDLF